MHKLRWMIEMKLISDKERKKAKERNKKVDEMVVIMNKGLIFIFIIILFLLFLQFLVGYMVVLSIG